MNKDIRWRQRFQNFEKAYFLLKSGIDKFNELSILEKEGLVQRFEYTFELTWKTLKDYLESQNVIVKFPREIIKQAFHYEIIKDGEIWMEMLEERNLMAHTYDEKIFKNCLDSIINSYFQAITQIYSFLKNK